MNASGASTRSRSRSRASGFSLLELVVALLIVSILLGAIGSAIVVASKALPGTQSPDEQTALAGRALALLAEDLRAAMYLTERTARAVTMVLPDRDGDGRPEAVRYAWSGVPGEPLTRQYQQAEARVLAGDVRDFTLAFVARTVTQSYPGAYTSSAEVLLASYDGAVNLRERRVERDKWVGQFIRPALPADASVWSLTRVKFLMRGEDAKTETARVQIRPARPDRLPGTTVTAEVAIPETRLAYSYSWVEAAFANVVGLSPDTGVCLVIAQSDASGICGRVCYDEGGSGRVFTDTAGTSWALPAAESLKYQAYGTYSAPGPDQSMTRRHVTAVRAGLRLGAMPAALEGAVPTANCPEVLSAVWEADFSASPTVLDSNGDGLPDWVARGGTTHTAASLVDGVWRADATLDTHPNCDFTKPTTVEARFRNTTVGGSGALVWINADWSDGLFAPLYATLQLQAGNTQKLTVYRKSNNSTPVALLTLTGLPSGFVDLALHIDPAWRTVNVQVNGVDRGTWFYSRFAPQGDDRFASVLTSGSQSEFDWVRIRVGE